MIDFSFHGTDSWPLHGATTGSGPVVVLLHGGGPDHHSLAPLADRLADRYTVVLPDVRGYGRSVCADPTRHTWAQYADDVAALLDHLDVHSAVVGGTGLGSTVALRACIAHPDRITAAILISVEDVEDDQAKQAEIGFMDAFADRVRTAGIQAAWEPVLGDLAPVIATLVRDAIPRSDAGSIAAAAAIGRDRSFRSLDELAGIAVPALVFPGIDHRHPPALAETLARLLPHGRLAPTAFSADLWDAEDLAAAVAPAIREFLHDQSRS